MKNWAFYEYKLRQLVVPLILMAVLLVKCFYQMTCVPAQYLGDTLVDKESFELFFLGRSIQPVTSNSILLWGIIFLLAFLLFREYGNQGMTELFRGLPYKKRALWFRSLFLGITVITIFYLLLALFALISYCCYWPEYHEEYLKLPAYDMLCRIDTLGNGWMFILQYWAVSLGIFSVAVFTRMAMGYGVAVVLSFLGITTAPYLLLEEIAYRFRIRKTPGAGIWQEWADRVLPLSVSCNSQLYFPGWDPDQVWWKGDGTGSTNVEYQMGVIQQVGAKYFMFDSVTILFWFGIAILFLILSYHMSEKECGFAIIARTSFYENAFFLGIGLYLALLVFCFVPGGISKSAPVMLLVFAVAETILLFVFKKKGRYDYLQSGKGGAYEKRE